jgi:multicomponent Na+:H+ antiporter subunit E
MGVVVRLAGLLALPALIWAVLSDGAAAAWLIGIPVVLAAAWAWARLSGPLPRLRAAAVPPFLFYFVRVSLIGGADVARRALSPTMNLQPEFVPVKTTLPEGPARTLAAAIVGLLPGTLCAQMENDTLLIHALDARQPVEAAVRELESHIAKLFGERAA